MTGLSPHDERLPRRVERPLPRRLLGGLLLNEGHARVVGDTIARAHIVTATSSFIVLVENSSLGLLVFATLFLMIKPIELAVAECNKARASDTRAQSTTLHPIVPSSNFSANLFAAPRWAVDFQGPPLPISTGYCTLNSPA